MLYFEIALFHEGVRPQFLHERLLPKNMPAIFDQCQECVEHLWGERHGFPSAQKQPFPLVDAKLAELVEVLDPLDHTPPSQIPDNFLTAPLGLRATTPSIVAHGARTSAILPQGFGVSKR